jgi:hypothetical protein
MFAPGGKPAGTGELACFAKALAATGIRNFWISLDSADTQTHEAMRGLPGVVEGIRRALPLFHCEPGKMDERPIEYCTLWHNTPSSGIKPRLFQNSTL